MLMDFGEKPLPLTIDLINKPENGLKIGTIKGVEVLVKYTSIHGTLMKDRHQDHQEASQYRQQKTIHVIQKRKLQINWLCCPECQVKCSREDFLLDHIIRKHTAKCEQKGPKEGHHKIDESDVKEEDHAFKQFHQTERSTHVKEIVYCEGDYSVFPPSMWRSLGNVMLISLLCGEHGLCHILQKILIAQLVDTNIQHLLQSGDVEQNPGPTYQCHWENCQKELGTFPALKLHVTEHSHQTKQCRWRDCSGFNSSDFNQQMQHSIHHVYQTKEYFPTLEDWCAVLASGRWTEKTNIHCCPKHLRSQLQLLLMDEDFETNLHPYTVKMHNDYLRRLSLQEQKFHELKEAFIKKRERLGEDWSSCSNIDLTTVASSSTTGMSSSEPFGLLKHQYDFVQTDRPELSTTSYSGSHIVCTPFKRKFSEANSPLPSWFTNLTNNLSVCQDAIIFQKSVLNALFEKSIVTSKNQNFLKLEQEAARLASIKNCTNGTFVYTSFKYSFCEKDIFYIRYVESGVYKGFMLQKHISHLKEKYNLTNENIFLHNVITAEDIKEMMEETEKDKSKRSRPDKIFNHCIERIVPLEVSNLRNIQPCSALNLESFMVHFLPLNTKATVDSKDKMYLEISEGEINDVRKTLIDFRLEKLDSSNVKSEDLFNDKMQCPANLLEQSIILNCLSGDQKRKSHLFKRSARFESNFLVHTTSATSLRLKTLDLYLQENMNGLLAFYKKFFPELDIQVGRPSESDMSCKDLAIPPPKTRKITKSLPKLTVTKEKVNRQIPPSNNNLEKDSTFNIYDNFCCTLLEKGKLSIQHFDKEDGLVVCCMNDYSDTDGSFRQNEFVHTLREKQETGDYFLCSCSIYRTLINLNKNDVSFNDNDCMVLDSEGANCVTCIHCKFLKEKVIPVLESENDIYQSRINQLIVNSKCDIGKKIVELSSNNDTHKYSIFSEDDDRPSFVHFTFNKRINNHLISCLNGKCVSLRGHKRSVSTLLSSSVCKHLTIFKENTEYWQHLVNRENVTMTSGSSASDETTIQSLNTPSTDNGTMWQKEIVFDEESGLWKFKCRSEHSPLFADNIKYRENVLKRDTWNDSSFSRLSDGCLKGSFLVSDIPDTPCDCGAGWTTDNNKDGVTVHDKSRVLTVYTMIAPVKFDIYRRLCIANQCVLYWDEGKKDALHVLSRDTAAGDEIGWEFVSMVINSGCTFSSYCQMKNDAYNLRHSKARFMDPTTFINWWFSWAANMKIDFRQPCGVCGFEPKRLCCDGTKVGVGFRHALFEEISKPSNDENVQQTLHRRMDRCFLKNLKGQNKQETIQHRETLNYLAKSTIGELNINEIINPDDLNARINSVKAVLPEDVYPSFLRFFDMHDSEKLAYAYVLKMLSTTASVTSFLPPSFCPRLQLLVNNPQTDSFNTILSEMRTYAPELRDLICETLICNNNNFPNDIRIFIQYLINESLNLESNLPEDPIPQHGSYNPAKFGRAYYFNKTGKKLRNIRKYTIDLDKTTKNNIDHDDIPLDFERCQKLYSKVQTSAPGTSSLFLWFCADHGHCYGFHMTGAEGRKDPSASLYSYLEKPPTDIFYDFSCNLQEYCLNRESGYYKNVRFFHDIFHSYSHKCSSAFKSSRLQGFESINSEICEQFNSFIQCIKKSARQMSQEHFCFYLQFFLNEWNKRKLSLSRKKLQVALASLTN